MVTRQMALDFGNWRERSVRQPTAFVRQAESTWLRRSQIPGRDHGPGTPHSQAPDGPKNNRYRNGPWCLKTRVTNDHGRDAGDALLRAIGVLIRTGIRRRDVPCRYGSEELVLILPGLGLDDAERRAPDAAHAQHRFAGVRGSHQIVERERAVARISGSGAAFPMSPMWSLASMWAQRTIPSRSSRKKPFNWPPWAA